MSDTPRTDAWTWDVKGQDTPMEAFEKFARQLERELNAANERIKRLEEAGDPLCAAAAFMGWHLEIEKWNKAKEVKL